MNLVVGADEVGRGAFAGPVVAGAVILPPDIEDLWNEDPKKLPVVIRDSKKMTEKQREKSAVWIQQNAIGFAVGEGSVEMINASGITTALQYAFREAVNSATAHCHSEIKKLLVDALIIKDLENFPDSKQEAIVLGDNISCHIAAASIVAKVYRDNLMKELSTQDNNHIYKWYSNKGYGTEDHRESIKLHGICCHHRLQYVRSSIKNSFSRGIS